MCSARILFGSPSLRAVGRKLCACTSWAVRLPLLLLVTRFTSIVWMQDFCRYWKMRGLRGWWLFSMVLRRRISLRARS